MCRYAYGNAYSADLFQSLTQAAGGAVNVSDFMQQWVQERQHHSRMHAAAAVSSGHHR